MHSSGDGWRRHLHGAASALVAGLSLSVVLVGAARSANTWRAHLSEWQVGVPDGWRNLNFGKPQSTCWQFERVEDWLGGSQSFHESRPSERFSTQLECESARQRWGQREERNNAYGGVIRRTSNPCHLCGEEGLSTDPSTSQSSYPSVGVDPPDQQARGASAVDAFEKGWGERPEETIDRALARPGCRDVLLGWLKNEGGTLNGGMRDEPGRPATFSRSLLSQLASITVLDQLDACEMTEGEKLGLIAAASICLITTPGGAEQLGDASLVRQALTRAGNSLVEAGTPRAREQASALLLSAELLGSGSAAESVDGQQLVEGLRNTDPTGVLDVFRPQGQGRQTIEEVQNSSSALPTGPSGVRTSQVPEDGGVGESLENDPNRTGDRVEGPGLQEVFSRAYRALTRGEYEQALLGFREFLSLAPWSDQADNAQYWIAECFYARHDYSSAVREFAQVQTRYPVGDRVPASLLKIAYCHTRLGDRAAASRVLRQLLDQYPDSDEAEMAKRKLGDLSSLDGTPDRPVPNVLGTPRSSDAALGAVIREGEEGHLGRSVPVRRLEPGGAAERTSAGTSDDEGWGGHFRERFSGLGPRGQESGLLVIDVGPSGFCSDVGLQADDVLVDVGGQAVDRLEALRYALIRQVGIRRDQLRLRILRGGQEVLTNVRINSTKQRLAGGTQCDSQGGHLQ